MFKSEAHNVFIKKINKIPFGFNNDKNLDSFNRVRLNLYRTSKELLHIKTYK